MNVEGKLKSKFLYKLELYSNKIIPMTIAGMYFMNTVLSFIGIDLEILSYIGHISFILIIKQYITSYTYRFCEYHRMFLHYIVINNIITIYDYYIGIPISARTLFSIHCIIAIIFLYIILYLKLKVCKKR